MIEFRLAVVMAEKKVRPKELAELAGLHYQTVLNALRNPQRVDFETLDKLCDALNCEPGDLLKRKRVEP
jgi:putative transcriptional regulator